MGRIPKLVKEKALAEHVSPTAENRDPTKGSSTSTNAVDVPSASSIVDTDVPLIDDNALFEDLNLSLLSRRRDCRTPSLLPACARYELPATFTIDETIRTVEDEAEDKRIVTLSQSALTHYMTNCEEHFSIDVVERMKAIGVAISHPTSRTQLDHEQSSFIRYLRWKLLDLSNTYNGRTSQLIERMNSMINLGVRHTVRVAPMHSFRPSRSRTFLAVRPACRIFGQVSPVGCRHRPARITRWLLFSDAIPSHVKNLIAFAQEVRRKRIHALL